MSIQAVTYRTSAAETRRPASGPAVGASFQEQLSAAGAQVPQAPIQAAPSRQELLSTLFQLKVQGMKASREVSEEQEDWDQLMDQMDAWIESLQEDADIEKSARAYAAYAAAHTDTPVVKRGAAEKCLLEHISNHFLG